MSEQADKYVGEFLKFLEGIGVSDQYFCEPQRERWISQLRKAYEELDLEKDE
jgi:hypothetical protein